MKVIIITNPTLCSMVYVLPLIEMLNLKSSPALSQESTLLPHLLLCVNIPGARVGVTQVVKESLSGDNPDLLLVDRVLIFTRRSSTDFSSSSLSVVSA